MRECVSSPTRELEKLSNQNEIEQKKSSLDNEDIELTNYYAPILAETEKSEKVAENNIC